MSPQPRGKLLTHGNGDEDGGGVDGDGSGGNSPSRQGAETETPELGFRMAAELWNFFGEIVQALRVFASGGISR